MNFLIVVEGEVIAQFVSETMAHGYADVFVETYGIYADVVAKGRTWFDRALSNAWECGVSYEQAIELAPLAAMSREEFDAEIAALDAAALAALEADARANP